MIKKKSFLRASLSEFVSTEEIVSIECNDFNNLKILKTKNPLFHLLKQLRNYNVHINTTEIEKKKIIFGTEEQHRTNTGLAYESEETIISDLTITEFNKPKDANRYLHNDKMKMIDWFNINQRLWGTSHLILLATIQFCDLIILDMEQKPD